MPSYQDAHSIQLQTRAFEGPLGLLMHLIEKNKMDIYDIPVAEITAQYMEVLAEMQAGQDEVSAEFLVMASTLLYIKSRLLLPQNQKLEGGDEDPREELVLRLLEYRRCKQLAQQLTDRRHLYGGSCSRLPMSAADLGIEIQVKPPNVKFDRFEKACQALQERNQFRFQNLQKKVSLLLSRDRMPLKERVRLIWLKLQDTKRLLFSEIVPVTASKAEKVSGFLAILEMLRMNQILVVQKNPFDVMLIEKNKVADETVLQRFLHDEKEDEYV